MSGYGLIVFLSMLVEAYPLAVLQNERPKCRNDESCTIEVNKTAHECRIGRKALCDTLKWPAVDDHAIPAEKVWLYPYLATVSIEEKSYIHEYSEAKLKALNFSFQLPRTSFGQGGVAQFVMAMFQNTVSGSIYEEPVCRLFDFREARQLSADIIALQNPTVPSDCLGLDLIPGVYSLRLTTISATFGLQYNITWLENEEDSNEPDVWVQKLMAVAVVHEERLVHIVFQPPKDFIPMVVVSLVNMHGRVRSEAVLRGRTSVMFTDVDSGQHQVIISPKGEECKELNCANMSSKSFLLDFTVAPKGDDYMLMVIIMVVLTPLFLIPMLLCIWKNKSCKQGQLVLLVNSLISRDLELKVAQQFCSLLTEVLGAKVIINCWHPAGESSCLIDARTSLLKHQVEVVPTSDGDLCKFDYKINMLFASTVHCLQDGLNQALHRDEPYKKACCFNAWVSNRETTDILTVIFSNQPQANSTIFEEETSTVNPTVLEYPGRRLLGLANSPSLNNAPDHLLDMDNLFYLPDQVDKFMVSLQHRHSRNHSNIAKSEHWKSIRSMLLKIAQHKPCFDNVYTSPGLSESFITIPTSDIESNKDPYNYHPHTNSFLKVCSEVSSSYSNISTAVAFLGAGLSDSLGDNTLCPNQSPVPFRNSGHPVTIATDLSGSCPSIISRAPSPESTRTSSIKLRDLAKGASRVSTPTKVTKHLNNNLESVPPDSGQGDSFESSFHSETTFNMESTYPPAFIKAVIPPE